MKLNASMSLWEKYSKHSNPFYRDESPLIPLDEWPLEKRIVTGLQRLQLGRPLQPFQTEVVGPFAVADLAGKARMLGPLWPKWRHLFE
jgi:hypothetical protein